MDVAKQVMDALHSPHVDILQDNYCLYRLRIFEIGFYNVRTKHLPMSRINAIIRLMY